jgi:hypothetical protein
MTSPFHRHIRRHPWRAVTRAIEYDGQHNAHNRGKRAAHWWGLDVECGHYVERTRRTDRPAPQRVRCGYCPREGS